MLYFYHVYKSEERIALPSDELVNLDRAFTEETSNAKFDVRNDRVDLVSTRIISKDSIINVYSGPSTIHMWEDGQWVQYWSLTPTNLYNESADFNPYDRHNNVQNGCKDNECGTVYNVKSSEFEFKCECFKYHVVCDNDIGCMCDPKICANRPFDTQLDKKTIVKDSPIQGKRLFAAENIKSNEWIIEYVGEVVSRGELEMRSEFYEKENSNYTTQSRPTDNIELILDATRIGNTARYANHSCNPNAATTSVLDKEGIPHLFLRSIRDIKKDEEIVWDYDEVVDLKSELIKCTCGAKACKKWVNRVKSDKERKEEEMMEVEGEKTRKEARIKNLIRDYMIKRELANQFEPRIKMDLLDYLHGIEGDENKVLRPEEFDEKNESYQDVLERAIAVPRARTLYNSYDLKKVRDLIQRPPIYLHIDTTGANMIPVKSNASAHTVNKLVEKMIERKKNTRPIKLTLRDQMSEDVQNFMTKAADLKKKYNKQTGTPIKKFKQQRVTSTTTDTITKKSDQSDTTDDSKKNEGSINTLTKDKPPDVKAEPSANENKASKPRRVALRTLIEQASDNKPRKEDISFIDVEKTDKDKAKKPRRATLQYLIQDKVTPTTTVDNKPLKEGMASIDVQKTDNINNKTSLLIEQLTKNINEDENFTRIDNKKEDKKEKKNTKIPNIPTKQIPETYAYMDTTTATTTTVSAYMSTKTYSTSTTAGTNVTTTTLPVTLPFSTDAGTVTTPVMATLESTVGSQDVSDIETTNAIEMAIESCITDMARNGQKLEEIIDMDFVNFLQKPGSDVNDILNKVNPQTLPSPAPSPDVNYMMAELSDLPQSDLDEIIPVDADFTEAIKPIPNLSQSGINTMTDPVSAPATAQVDPSARLVSLITAAAEPSASKMPDVEELNTSTPYVDAFQSIWNV